MRAPFRVLVAATALAALGTLGLAYGAHAAPPQIDQRHIDRQHPSRQDHDQTWKCNAGHGPQLDCRDAGSLTGRRPSTSPATSTQLAVAGSTWSARWRCSAYSPRWPRPEPG